MLPSHRHRALRLLVGCRPSDPLLGREVEALCHAASLCAVEYYDHVRRAAHNLRENPSVGEEVVGAPDDALVEGTLVGRIEREKALRDQRFEQMLQEKYEALDDATFASIVRCRKCGSNDVSWEEKQTRSADEGATVFVTCTKCKHRWVQR